MTVLDGLIVKDMQDMKQEDTMPTARLDRHEAAHDERIGRLEATILEGCEPTFGSIIKN